LVRKKNLAFPAEIGGVKVVAIGGGGSFGHLNSVVIPDNVVIMPGAFISDDLFGWNRQKGGFLGGGITIGENVLILGKNAVAGWDSIHNSGALDPGMRDQNNFTAYESEHLGYWLDIGFIKIYSDNNRRAGRYTWSSSYDRNNYRYTFTWSFAPR